jgi:peptidoglycan/LPS O-acetylase OafA/YrhL
MPPVKIRSHVNVEIEYLRAIAIFVVAAMHIGRAVPGERQLSKRFFDTLPDGPALIYSSVYLDLS